MYNRLYGYIRSLIDRIECNFVDVPTTDGRYKSGFKAVCQSPSRWYLTGFLVPTEANEEQRCDPTSDDELDQAEPVSIEDDKTPEKPAARRSYYPSSMGLSLLVPAGSSELTAVVRYGDYSQVPPETGQTGPSTWRRTPREETVELSVGDQLPGNGAVAVPNSRGVDLVWSIRGVPDVDVAGGLPKGTCCLSLFVVNRRKAAPDEVRDEGFIFQVELEVRAARGFIARPNLHSLESEDLDERVNDLQYRHVCEISVGHSVATEAESERVGERKACRVVRTCWLPTTSAYCISASY